MRWLLRAKRWAHHPPSAKRVKFTFAVIALCLGIYAVEKTVGLPDWMDINSSSRVDLRRISP